MIELAAAADRSYVPWLATAIRSALDRHPDGTLRFHVLHDGQLTGEQEQRLNGMVGAGGGFLLVHDVSGPLLGRLPVQGGRVVWLRLLLPELVEEARVLYLDADTLVVDDLRPLWESPMRGTPLAAVANVVEPAMRPHLGSLGIPPDRRVFNSGVLLLDLDRVRSEGVFDEVLDFARRRENSSMVWPDQDALNAVLTGRWHELHPRWNAQNSLWTWTGWAEEVFGADAVHEAVTAPAVLHFEGPHLRKPWHQLSEHPWTEAYRRTLASTPWAGAAPADRTWATRLIAHLPPEHRVPAFLRLLRWRAAAARGRGAVNRRLRP